MHCSSFLLTQKRLIRAARTAALPNIGIHWAVFLLAFFVFAGQVPGYTVFLHSGKRVDGRLIGEDGATVRIRDRTGIELSFRKGSLDLSKMAQVNAPASPLPAAGRPAVEFPGRDVARLARDLRASRTGTGRTYTALDIDGMPELTLLGSPDGIADGEGNAEEQSPGNERYWRSTAASLNRALAVLEEKKRTADEKCSKARGRPSIRTVPRKSAVLELADLEPPECNTARTLSRQLREAEERSEDFREKARRSGIPREWVE